MRISIYRLGLSVGLLILLLLGTALAIASQPDYPATPSQQFGSTPAPIFLTATAIFEELTGSTSNTSDGESIDEIEHYNAHYDYIVDELQEKGVIPIGGNLIYETNYAFFDGTGGWYTDLAQYRPHTNYIMSGELNFTVSDNADDIEFCGFITRVQAQGYVSSINLLTGFLGDGTPALLDFPADNDRTVDVAFTTYDMDEPHFYTIVVQDETILIFIDGELALENDELDVRKGSYGIVLDSEGYGARCEVNNVWIYELDNVWDDDEGYCGINTPNAINLRGGPGTTYALEGQLTPNEVYSVEGQFLASDGFIWWQLTTGNWVRSDLVDEIGDCETLAPEVEPEE